MADYVIVGAGSAGCVLAGRLSEDPDVDGAAAGGRAARTPQPSSTSRRCSRIVFKSSLDWDLFGEEEPGLGGRRLYLPRGRVIGGSSSINAMIYLRGHRADFDDWAEHGLRRAGRYDEVLPVLQALRGQRARRERVPRRRRPARGVRQPLHVPARRRAAGGCGPGGLRADRGPERRPAGGRLALPAHAAQRHALQRRRRVPAPGARRGRTSR